MWKDSQHGGVAEAPPQAECGPQVVTISCVFPNPRDPSYGCFVRSRVSAVSAYAGVRVIAPVPVFDWSQRRGPAGISIPAASTQGRVRVRYPRWLYPPAGGAGNAVLLFAQLLPVLWEMRRRQPFDLLDAHFAYPDGIAAAMLARVWNVPFTITLRGNETMHARYPLRGKLMAWALRRAARVIAVSGELSDFAVRLGADPARVRMIPNGVDTHVFYPRDRARCRRKWGIPDTARVVLSAGALIERKGHHLTAAAVRRAQEAGIEAMLLIAGGPGREGNFEQPLRKRIEELGLRDSARLLGRVSAEQMAELMSASDVLALASSREGWPNVVHEALACGTPVVATDVGSCRDLLPSAVYGVLVRPGDQAALEQALAAALRTEWNRTEIARWGGARSWEQVAAEVASLFEEVRHG